MNLNTVADTKLVTVTGVDVNVLAKTSLYTVPAGKTLIVTKIVIRNASANLTTADFGVGFNANADDVIASETWVELTGSTLYTLRLPMDGAIRGAAGDVLGLKCSVAEGAPATVTVDVFGYLI